MYLLFPNTQTLQIAIASGLVPESLAAAPAEYATHDDGRVWVKPSVKLESAARDALKPLGVAIRKSTRGAGSSVASATCWPQILPLEKIAARSTQQAGLGEREPVLFDLPASANLADVVTEMLRLGNDRQSFRQHETPLGPRTLLLVKGPPYYTLLRAIDQLDGPATPRAFVEQAPGVWVQLGYRHPLGEQIQPAEGTFLLLSHPREWTAITEGKYQDIYRALEFTIPGEATLWETDELDEQLKVHLKLVRGGAEEPAEFWVLSDAGVSQLEALVQSADDRLISRLAFAVGTSPHGTEERTVVVKVRPGKEPPPVLVLDGVACRSYLRLPNLFVPVGKRLHPPLRRDAVKDLLAGDDNLDTWLLPGESGNFLPQSLPDNAFRPLTDWVDYVLDCDREALRTWSEAMRFDFESFICPDEKPDPSPKVRKRRQVKQQEKTASAPTLGSAKTASAKAKNKRVQNSKKPNAQPSEYAAPPPPSELQLKLDALEQQFREMPEPLHSPARHDVWRELAATNLALGQSSEGGLCYSNGLWDQDSPDADWIADWYVAEMGGKQIPPMTGEDFAAAVSAKRPTPSQLGLLAIHLIAAAFQEVPVSEAARKSLEQAQAQLKQYDKYLPLRMTWFAWLAYAKIAEGDFLALARARDRVLERLYDYGLSPEMDLPGFLRSTGPQTGKRFRAVKDAMLDLRGRAQSWIDRELEEQKTSGQGQTAAYADLMIAFGYARVGLTSECKELLESARAQLQKPAVANPIHNWFLEAFRQRITQALEGQAGTSSLSDELMKPLIEKTFDSGTVFIIDSLRSKSRILQPYELIGSHTRQIAARAKGQLDLDAKLEHLSDIENREERADSARQLVEMYGGVTILESFNLELNNQALLTGLLQHAPHLGDTQTSQLLDQVPETLDQLDEPGQQAALLNKAMFAAAHFGHPARVRQFIEQLRELMETASSPETAESFGMLLGQSFRGLRKLGMRGEIAGLLDHLETLDEAKRFEMETPASGKGKKRRSLKLAKSREDAELSRRMQAMTLRLNLAAGWFYFGNEERAQKIIEDASQFLFESLQLKPHLRRKFARRYAAVLELAPTEVAIPKLSELFTRLTKITKGQGAGLQDEYYAYELLEVIDSVVLALVSDEMTLDPKTREIMDELEFSIRKRIHRDMELAQQTSGI